MNHRLQRREAAEKGGCRAGSGIHSAEEEALNHSASLGCEGCEKVRRVHPVPTRPPSHTTSPHSPMRTWLISKPSNAALKLSSSVFQDRLPTKQVLLAPSAAAAGAAGFFTAPVSVLAFFAGACHRGGSIGGGSTEARVNEWYRC